MPIEKTTIRCNFRSEQEFVFLRFGQTPGETGTICKPRAEPEQPVNYAGLQSTHGVHAALCGFRLRTTDSTDFHGTGDLPQNRSIQASLVIGALLGTCDPETR